MAVGIALAKLTVTSPVPSSVSGDTLRSGSSILGLLWLRRLVTLSRVVFSNPPDSGIPNDYAVYRDLWTKRHLVPRVHIGTTS